MKTVLTHLLLRKLSDGNGNGIGKYGLYDSFGQGTGSDCSLRQHVGDGRGIRGMYIEDARGGQEEEGGRRTYLLPMFEVGKWARLLRMPNSVHTAGNILRTSRVMSTEEELEASFTRRGGASAMVWKRRAVG